MVIRERETTAAATKEKADTTALAAVTTSSYIENLGEVLVKAHLFNEVLKAATDFNGMTIRKFVQS